MTKERVFTPPQVAKRIYTAFITQTGTNNPVMVEIENTTGKHVTPVRLGVGSYQLTGTADMLAMGNTFRAIVIPNDANGPRPNAALHPNMTGNLQWDQVDSTSGIEGDGIVASTSVTIEIYNLQNM